MRNIEFSDKFIGTFVFGYRILKSSFDYFLISYLLLENWYDAMLMRGGVKKDCILRTRPKSIKRTISGRMIHVFAKNIDDYGIKDGCIFLKYRNRSVNFSYTNDYQLTNTITGIKEQFIEEPYGSVDIKNRVVLDIGASIADSAIYFALNGAKSVIALEPYPYTYKIAKENVGLNRLQNKILLINKACLARYGSVVIDPNFQNNDRNDLKLFRKGRKIAVTNLNELVSEYGINDAVLKIDCEGYEYEIIENSSIDLLRKFSTIVLEYHYGFRNLEEKLHEAGFKVRHTVPFYTGSIDDKVNVLCGLLYAEREPIAD